MFRLRSDQQAYVAFEFRDRKGNKTVAENARLESSDPDVATILADADGMGFTVIAGQPGVTQLNFSVDAQLGDGERIITGTDTLEVVPGEAAILKLVFSAAEAQSLDVPAGPAPTTPDFSDQGSQVVMPLFTPLVDEPIGLSGATTPVV